MPSPKNLSSGRDDWQTPPDIIELIEKFSGGLIGFDPCGAANNPARAIVNWYPPEHDGLRDEWPHEAMRSGVTFINPPFKHMSQWARYVAEHWMIQAGYEIIMLGVPRTDTAWFRHFWTARALAFWHGSKGTLGHEKDPLRSSRLKFVNPQTGKGVAGNTSPSVFAYWGPRPMQFARTFSPYARVIFP